MGGALTGAPLFLRNAQAERSGRPDRPRNHDRRKRNMKHVGRGQEHTIPALLEALGRQHARIAQLEGQSTNEGEWIERGGTEDRESTQRLLARAEGAEQIARDRGAANGGLRREKAELEAQLRNEREWGKDQAERIVGMEEKIARMEAALKEAKANLEVFIGDEGTTSDEEPEEVTEWDTHPHEVRQLRRKVREAEQRRVNAMRLWEKAVKRVAKLTEELEIARGRQDEYREALAKVHEEAREARGQRDHAHKQWKLSDQRVENLCEKIREVEGERHAARDAAIRMEAERDAEIEKRLAAAKPRAE